MVKPKEVNISKFQSFIAEFITYCKKCDQKRTIKSISETDFTIKCGCGCEIYKRYEPDEYHKDSFYTRSFVSKKQFNKAHHKK